MNLQLIKASADNIFTIQTLACRIWQVAYLPIIGQKQIDYMLQMMYSLDAMRLQMERGHQFYLIQAEGENVGFMGIESKNEVNLHSTPERELFIHKFYIDNGKQRSGIGSKVFVLMLESQSIVSEVRLQVNRLNYKAINFYFKLGFVIEKVADFDIGGGYFMNDFIMLWRRNQQV
ncbi:MAG: N-acetyltransferase [Flavobacteriaceae bacterium]|nr:N-acetyltransferase [Flavobacteriaceae bacterium]